MNNLDPPPKPNELITLEIRGLPVRLWWKLMETAQKKGTTINYLVFKLLVDAVGFNGENESYDLVVKEIERYMEQ